MPKPESSDLDSDLRLRLSQAMLNQSLRPTLGGQKATLIVGEEEDERAIQPTLVRDEREQQKAQERDVATVGVGLPRRMGNWQELVLLPLSEASDGVIGVGGEGVVYSYVQRELGREVAVKTLRADRWSYGAIESLLREACVTARLEHPNVVPVHYLHLPEYDGDSPYWVMKRIQGKPLTEHLPGGKDPWPFGKLLDVFRRVLDAVAFAHSRGVVHRDLKPDNVLVGEFGEVQVSDWGLAVAVNEEGARGAAPLLQDGQGPGEDGQQQSATGHADGERGYALSEELARLNDDVRSGRIGALLKTSAGGRAGTPAYMAPEQLQITAGGISERTDVFLLGAVLYAILTGGPPHRLDKGDDTGAARRRLEQIRSCSTIARPQEQRESVRLRAVPEGLSTASMQALSKIVMRALSEDIRRRFRSVDALTAALGEWEAQSESQELYEQAQTRMTQVKASGRRRATVCAEAMALADASLKAWQGNRPAEELRNQASAQLAAIQRRSVKRLWIAVAAVTSMFVGAVMWSRSIRDGMEDLTRLQAELAMEFNLAIRDYVGTAIRPEMQKRIGRDEFVVEAMSTGYVAREVFDRVKRSFPDYLIKFSSENPRNPANIAGPAEKEKLDWFRRNPQEQRWVGKIEMDGREYFAYLSAMRFTQACMRCHSDPDRAPRSLVARYGGTRGFHCKVGDVAGMDTVAIPLDKVRVAMRRDLVRSLAPIGAVLLVLLAALILVR